MGSGEGEWLLGDGVLSHEGGSNHMEEGGSGWSHGGCGLERGEWLLGGGCPMKREVNHVVRGGSVLNGGQARTQMAGMWLDLESEVCKLHLDT